MQRKLALAVHRGGNHEYEWMELLDDRIKGEGDAIQMTAASSLFTQSSSPPALFQGLDSHPAGMLWCHTPEAQRIKGHCVESLCLIE